MTPHDELEHQADTILTQAGYPELVHQNQNDALHPSHRQLSGDAHGVERAARRNPNRHYWDHNAAIRHAIHDGSDHDTTTFRAIRWTPRIRITDANTMPNPPHWIYGIRTTHRHAIWLATQTLLATTSTNTHQLLSTNHTAGK